MCPVTIAATRVVRGAGTMGVMASLSGSKCCIGSTTFWSVEVGHSHSAWAWFHRILHSIYGNCVLPIQPSSQGNLEVCWVNCDTSRVQMSSEGDVAFSSTDEVAIVQVDVLEVGVISALTVLSDAPIHLILYCAIDTGRLSLQKWCMEWACMHNLDIFT